jgi:hypothetical protein
MLRSVGHGESQPIKDYLSVARAGKLHPHIIGLGVAFDVSIQNLTNLNDHYKIPF